MDRKYRLDNRKISVDNRCLWYPCVPRLHKPGRRARALQFVLSIPRHLIRTRNNQNMITIKLFMFQQYSIIFKLNNLTKTSKLKTTTLNEFRN